MNDNDTGAWPDDSRRAAATLALAAGTQTDEQVDDVIASIKAGVNSGRPVQYVQELLRMLTARPTQPRWRATAFVGQLHGHGLGNRAETMLKQVGAATTNQPRRQRHR